MSIEEKGKRSLANAQARVKDENGGQDHEYNEDATAGHITGEFEHKGEDVKRTEKASTVTAGRRVTSKKGWAAGRYRT